MRKIKGLYKRGKVFWMCFMVDGKTYRRSTGKTTQKEAVEVLKDSKKEVEDSRVLGIDKGKCMFAELAKKYDEIFAKKQKGYSTKKYIIRQLVDEFGSFKIRALDVETIERYQTKFLSTHKPATTNRLIACLKHMITKAVDWDMASEDTLRRIRKVKNLAESNKRTRFLNVNECQRLIECCATHLKPIVITALNTGMRRGEILTLKWEQIDLLHGYITLVDTKSGEGREVPINDTMREMLKAMPHSIESVYVFTDRNGKPYKYLTHSFATAMRKAEICNFKFHDLRHTFCSQLVMKGVDLTTVKELVGHKKITMTTRYAHLAPEHKSKAVKILDEVMQNPTQEKLSSQFTSQFEDNLNIDSSKSLNLQALPQPFPACQPDRQTCRN